MPFTASTANNEVRALINEATASYWSDTEIDNWVKQGCLDWCEKSLLLIAEDTVVLVTDQLKYTTSGSSHIDNAIRTLHAEHNGKAMQRLTYEQMRGHNAPDALGSDPYPKYFYDQYDNLVFTFYVGPAPSSTYNGQTITLQWALRTDDITKIPYEYQQVVFLYAASKAKIKERQFDEASLMWQQYINNIIFSRRDSLELGQQPTDSFRVK